MLPNAVFGLMGIRKHLSFESIISLTIFLTVAFIIYQLLHKRHQRKQTRTNGPQPLPIVGNLVKLTLWPRDTVETRLRKEYGKVFSVFYGKELVVVISDAEVIKKIATQDFEYFPNHGNVQHLFNSYFTKSLFFLRDGHWKRVRALMSPTFTSGKIKRMSAIITRCADDLLEHISEDLPIDDKQASVVIENKKYYSLFTINAIASCCYALKLERKKNDGDVKSVANRLDMAEMLFRLFENNWDMYRSVIAFMLPKYFERFLWKPQSTKIMEVLDKFLVEVIKQRKEGGVKLDDYLQILLDARLSDDMELGETDAKENHHAGLTTESILEDQEAIKKVALSDERGELGQDELIANAIFLLIVGYETTSTLLAQLSYTLAHHPNIQEKLFVEIQKIARYSKNDSGTEGHDFAYEDLTACSYLDAVISETLRIIGPVNMIDRQASKDYLIEKYNVFLPKDAKIHFSFFLVHHDPEYWPEPYKFDPERFMPGNKHEIVPGSYAPFGLGPRHCLGMRFSLTETKMAMAKIVMKFKFSPIESAPWPPRWSRHIRMRISNVGVRVSRR